MQKKISSVPFKGTPEQEAKLNAFIEENKSDPSRLMAVMQEAQEIYGYLPMEVQQMIADLKENVADTENDDEVKVYLEKILKKEAFDRSGLIYGMGHAIYTLSDPRAEILKEAARKLSEAEGYVKEFELYDRVERLAKDLITNNRAVQKPVCANVDLYSGFVYSVLKIPVELFTPMFAIARISGWSAHRIEELVNHGKIIRPAYKYVGNHKEYLPMDERDW
jgi:citrate synthase